MVKKINLENGRLTEKQLKKIISDFQADEQQKYLNQEQYYLAKNTNILSRIIAENTSNAPDNKIPIAYGRKIVKTIAGYIARPGYITYNYNNDDDKNYFNEVYRINQEPILLNELATYQSINGFAYELHYIKDKPGTDEINYRMALVKAYDGIALYNYDIEPDIICFIRLYKKGDIEYYEVYYNDIIELLYKEKSTGNIKKENEVKNIFGRVPVIVYQNNDEMVGDIEPVDKLIDAYDILYSDSLNEFDRFAWAYLLIAGQGLEEDDAKEIKRKRIFENLENTEAVKFLTKDINTAFVDMMKDWTRQEIHKQSGIPDIENISIGSQVSGLTIQKFIYLMEYAIVDKDAFIRAAIEERNDLIDVIRDRKNEGVEIVMKRNVPDDNNVNADIYTKYDGRGISRKTLMENFATFVKDPEKELEEFDAENQQKVEEIEAENQRRFEMMQLNQNNNTEEDIEE